MASVLSHTSGECRVGQESHTFASHDGEDSGGEGQLNRLYESTVDRPCQALVSCGTGFENFNCRPNMGFLSVFRPLDNNSHDASSCYLYSSSAPVGPISCEYCGAPNTDDCDKEACPRPKLFFLKKKPPFASDDGWNPKTAYRNDMFEPPSSADGGWAAWGEVRGAVGRGVGGNGSFRRHRGNSISSTHAGTEVSLSSDRGGGRTADRPSSPATWVSELFNGVSSPMV